MNNDRLLFKQEIEKIVKHEFDHWLNTNEVPFCRYKEMHCVLSPQGFLSVVHVIPKGHRIILAFDRESDGDVLTMDRVQRAVDNNWFDLQGIAFSEYYERLLGEIDCKKQ